MVAFGVAGYFFRKLEISLVPIILGLLQGSAMEQNLRYALEMSDDRWAVLVGSPLAIGRYVFSLTGLILPVSWVRYCVLA